MVFLIESHLNLNAFMKNLLLILVLSLSSIQSFAGGGGFENTQVPHSIGIQYMTLGGGFLFGGLFLYAYIDKKK